MKSITGVYSLDEGKIRFQDQDVTSLAPGERKPRIEMIYQDLALAPTGHCQQYFLGPRTTKKLWGSPRFCGQEKIDAEALSDDRSIGSKDPSIHVQWADSPEDSNKQLPSRERWPLTQNLWSWMSQLLPWRSEVEGFEINRADEELRHRYHSDQPSIWTIFLLPVNGLSFSGVVVWSQIFNELPTWTRWSLHCWGTDNLKEKKMAKLGITQCFTPGWSEKCRRWIATLKELGIGAVELPLHDLQNLMPRGPQGFWKTWNGRDLFTGSATP